MKYENRRRALVCTMLREGVLEGKTNSKAYSKNLDFLIEGNR
jgi:hypothetical protein